MNKESIDILRLSKGVHKNLKKLGHQELKLSEVQQSIAKSLGFKTLYDYLNPTIQKTKNVQQTFDYNLDHIKNKLKRPLDLMISFVLNLISRESGVDIQNLSIGNDNSEILYFHKYVYNISSGFDCEKNINNFLKKLQSYYSNSEKFLFVDNVLLTFDFINVLFILKHIGRILNKFISDNSNYNNKISEDDFSNLGDLFVSFNNEMNNAKENRDLNVFIHQRVTNCYLSNIIKSLVIIEQMKENNVLALSDLNNLFKNLEMLDRKQFDLLKCVFSNNKDFLLSRNSEFFKFFPFEDHIYTPRNKSLNNLSYFSLSFIGHFILYYINKQSNKIFPTFGLKNELELNENLFFSRIFEQDGFSSQLNIYDSFRYIDENKLSQEFSKLTFKKNDNEIKKIQSLLNIIKQITKE